jgi:hypothetical protein
MVGLGVAVTKPLDDVRLPQWAFPGEPLAVQPGAQVEQFAHPAWSWQRAVPDVVVDVEQLVLGPEELPPGP